LFTACVSGYSTFTLICPAVGLIDFVWILFPLPGFVDHCLVGYGLLVSVCSVWVRCSTLLVALCSFSFVVRLLLFPPFGFGWLPPFRFGLRLLIGFTLVPVRLFALFGPFDLRYGYHRLVVHGLIVCVWRLFVPVPFAFTFTFVCSVLRSGSFPFTFGFTRSRLRVLVTFRLFVGSLVPLRYVWFRFVVPLLRWLYRSFYVVNG
jgi:hypothetical protein